MQTRLHADSASSAATSDALSQPPQPDNRRLERSALQDVSSRGVRVGRSGMSDKPIGLNNGPFIGGHRPASRNLTKQQGRRDGAFDITCRLLAVRIAPATRGHLHGGVIGHRHGELHRSS